MKIVIACKLNFAYLAMHFAKSRSPPTLGHSGINTPSSHFCLNCA